MGSTGQHLMAGALRNRGIVRAPIWLYRRGLGGLMGPRILMLEHIGRTSGKQRYACLEVVERPAPDTFVVVSGFGESAQWYRNLIANPRCWVTNGWGSRRPAHATPMNAAESAAALGRYRAAHPRAWENLSGAIEDATGAPVASLPMARLNRS